MNHLRSTGIAVALTVGFGLTALAQTPPSSQPGPTAGTSPAPTRHLPTPLRLAVFADSRARWVVLSLSV